MKISALVTTYRRFAKVCRCIDAIQAQTHPVEEIIVIDNGSPDVEYEGLAGRYAEAPVPVNVVRLSRGTHTQAPLRDSIGREISIICRDTMNVAFGLARGDWFAPCHDDDEWMPHKIATQATYRNVTGSLFVGCSILNRTETGEVQGVHHDCYGQHGTEHIRGVTDVTDCLREFNPLAVSGLLFHRSVVERVGGFQAWVPDEAGAFMRTLAASDWDFYRRASSVTRLLRVDEPLVWYEVGNVKHEGHMLYA